MRNRVSNLHLAAHLRRLKADEEREQLQALRVVEAPNAYAARVEALAAVSQRIAATAFFTAIKARS